MSPWCPLIKQPVFFLEFLNHHVNKSTVDSIKRVYHEELFRIGQDRHQKCIQNKTVSVHPTDWILLGMLQEGGLFRGLCATVWLTVDPHN